MQRKAALSAQPAKKIALTNFMIPTASPTAADTGVAQLADAVAAIHQQKAAPQSLGALYHVVETLCDAGHSELLYSRLRQQCSEHLHRCLTTLVQALQLDMLEFLRVVAATWQRHCEQMILLRSIFVYLDRKYALKTAGVELLWDMGLKLFLSNVLADRHVGEKLTSGALALVEQERRGQEIDRALLRTVVRMLRDVGVYAPMFEEPFLSATEAFYAEQSARLINDMTPSQYIAHADQRLREEAERVEQCMHSVTRRPLLTMLEDQLVRRRLPVILERGLPGMVAEDRMADLQLLHALAARVDGLELLRDAFRACLKTAGAEMVLNAARDKTMVDDLLAYKQRMDAIAAGPFAGDGLFQNAVKDGFESFVNQRHNKPAELIAKYMDLKLRTGYKDMGEDELEALLDRVMVLFRFVNGKDVFEAFYKSHLAKRLLLLRSASDDLERSMLLKLKAECGGAFTVKMEGMLKDVSTSRDITLAFRTYCSSRAHLSTNIDLSVNVLTLSNWPSYPPTALTLPKELSTLQEAFQTFYTMQHANRKLTWQAALGFCVLRANFPLGSKDLHVSLYQAAVLMLFNEAESLAYPAIKEATGIEEKALKLTLLSLAVGVARVLTKEPKGKEVAADSVFQVNAKFKSQHKRVKINQIQLRETEEEQEATSEKVFQDRQYTIDAAIVRIMKMRKKLKHNNLIAEVIEQLRFPVKTADLKKRIESLIEREYLERDSEDASTYKYLA